MHGRTGESLLRRLLLIPGLLITGCSDNERTATKSGGNMTAAAVASEASRLRFQAGLWETRTEITKIAVQGVAPEKLKAATGTPTTTRSCMSAAEATNPGADFLSGTKDGNCAYQRFSMANGRVDAAMTCAPAGVPGKVALTLAGTFTPASFAQTMNMRVDLPVTSQDMTMTARVAAKRIGPCNPQTENKS